MARTDQNAVDAIAVENLEIRTLGQKILIRKRQNDPVTVRLQDPLHGGRELQVERGNGLGNHDTDGLGPAIAQVHGHFVFPVAHLFCGLHHFADRRFADVPRIARQGPRNRRLRDSEHLGYILDGHIPHNDSSSNAVERYGFLSCFANSGPRRPFGNGCGYRERLRESLRAPIGINIARFD